MLHRHKITSIVSPGADSIFGWDAGKPVAPNVNVQVDASKEALQAQSRRAARAVKPGSFMHLMMNSTHSTDGRPFSDAEMIAQAFVFLLAGGSTVL